MNVDERGHRAAQTLRETTVVDVESELQSLYRLRRRRTAERGGLLVGAVLVAAWMIGTPFSQQSPPQPAEPAPSTRIPALPSDYEVLDFDVSPSGTRTAYAAFRDRGMPGVFVRSADSGDVESLWSVPRPTVSAGEDLPWAVAVDWAPDESQLGFVTLQHQPGNRLPPRKDVTVYTVALDGSEARVVSDDLGSCYCLSSSPSLTWSTQLGLRVTVPTGTRLEVFTLDPEP